MAFDPNAFIQGTPQTNLMPTAVDPKQQINDSVKKWSSHFGIDEDLVFSTIHQESRGKPDVVSPKGAAGLMQLMPETAAEMGVTDPYDIDQNIMGGIKYLKMQLDNHNGDQQLALAAYNAGPGAVKKYGGIPPYNETQDYVKKIMGNLAFKKFDPNSFVSGTPAQTTPNVPPMPTGEPTLSGLAPGEVVTNIPGLTDRPEPVPITSPQVQPTPQDLSTPMESPQITPAPPSASIPEPEAPWLGPKTSLRAPEEVDMSQYQDAPLFSDIANSAQKLGISAGRTLQFAGEKMGYEDMASLGHKIAWAYKNRPTQQPGAKPKSIEGDIVENPKMLLNPRYWTWNIAEMAPHLAIGMGAGGAAKGSVMVGGQLLKLTPQIVAKLSTAGAWLTAGATGGVMEGMGTYDEMLDKGFSEEEAQKAASGTARATGLLNAISFGQLFKKLPDNVLGKARKRLLGGATEAITEWLEEPATAVSKGTATGEDVPEIVKNSIQAIREGVNVLPVSFLLGLMGAGAASPSNKGTDTGELLNIKAPPEESGVTPIDPADEVEPEIPLSTIPEMEMDEETGKKIDALKAQNKYESEAAQKERDEKTPQKRTKQEPERTRIENLRTAQSELREVNQKIEALHKKKKESTGLPRRDQKALKRELAELYKNKKALTQESSENYLQTLNDELYDAATSGDQARVEAFIQTVKEQNTDQYVEMPREDVLESSQMQRKAKVILGLMKKGALPANAVERLGIKKSGESYQTTQLDKTRKLMKEQEQESPVTETETPVTAIETAPVYTPEQQQEMKRYIRPVQHIDTELETASEPRLREALEDNKELIQDRLFSEATNFGKVEKAAKELEKRNIPYVYGRGDIDNMKAINDKYGDNHPRANEDIRALLGKNLVGTINDLGGIIGRDQGDELKWVVPGKTKVEVDAAIEKGRKNILIEMKKLGLDKLTHIRENVPNYGAGDISYGNLDAKPGHYKENNDNAEAMTKLMKVKKLLNAKKNSNVIDEGGTNDVTKRLEGNGDKSQSTTGKTGTSIGKETQQQTPKSAAKTDGTTKSLAPEFEQPQTVPIDIMESLYGPPEDNDQHQKAKDNVKASIHLNDEKTLDLIIRKIQNSFKRVLTLQRTAIAAGVDIKESQDVNLAEEQFPGLAATVTEDASREYFDPIFNKMEEHGLSLDDMWDYLEARHAPERNAHIASIREDMPDGGSGIKTADAK